VAVAFRLCRPQLQTLGHHRAIAGNLLLGRAWTLPGAGRQGKYFGRFSLRIAREGDSLPKRSLSAAGAGAAVWCEAGDLVPKKKGPPDPVRINGGYTYRASADRRACGLRARFGSGRYRRPGGLKVTSRGHERVPWTGNQGPAPDFERGLGALGWRFGRPPGLRGNGFPRATADSVNSLEVGAYRVRESWARPHVDPGGRRGNEKVDARHPSIVGKEIAVGFWWPVKKSWPRGEMKPPR